MILQFKFKYLSNNGTLIKFIKTCASSFECEYKVYKEDEFIVLYVQAPLEVLELFSTSLGTTLPMSIYLYETQVVDVASFPIQESININDDFVLPFCTSCLNEVNNKKSKNYYNSFTSCENCTNIKNKSEFILRNKDSRETFLSNEKSFAYFASLINDNKSIKIKTFSGTAIFSKISNIDKCKSILCTNLFNLSSILVASKDEVVALASIEKPLINLKINEIYKNKTSCLKNSIDVRFANDFILYLLSLELEKLNIHFIAYDENIENLENSDRSEGKEDIKHSQADYILDFENTFNLIDIPKIKILSNSRKIILESFSYKQEYLGIYNSFSDHNKGQFMVLLNENNLLNKSIINFYFSSTNGDNISLHSQKVDGLLDILNIKLPSSIKELFEEIKKDETGESLLNNYKKIFPLEYEKAINTALDKSNQNSFSSLLKIAKIILNFKNDILQNANNALLDKGPRIDYKLYESKNFYNKEFDYTKLFKSAISFKLAGVDDITISLGYIESLAHFIANVVDTTDTCFSLDGVSLCGDMFTNDLFSKIVHKSITKNFKIYYNKDFPIQLY